MSDPRFEDLVGRLLDGELAPDEWSELLGLVREGPTCLAALRDQLEVAEMLSLSDDPARSSPLFLEATRSRLAEEQFVSGVRAALQGRPPSRRGGGLPRWPWASSAATPIESEIEDCYVFTVNVEAGLEVVEVELLPLDPGP